MPGHGHKQRGRSRKVNWQHVPTDSLSHPDPPFFRPTNSLLVSSSHSQSKTWKSSDARERDQFSRAKILLHHFVPHSPFLPESLAEWMAHRAAMQEEGKELLLKDIAIKQASRSADSRRPFKSTFGSGSPHPLHDNRSTVLSLPSIWSSTYAPPWNRPNAPWPERAEMQHEGEDRAGGDGGQTNFGRFLPLPRQPIKETVKWELKAVMESLSTIDMVGMQPTAADEEGNEMGMLEVWMQNKDMDFDNEFWDQGEHYLGKNLMDQL